MVNATYVRSSEKCEQFAARNEIHDHVEIGRILEGAPEIYDERMLNSLEHMLFIIRMFNLLQSDDFLFAEHFDGVESQVVFTPYYLSNR